MMAWGGKVFAVYEAGMPVELDPATLETRGVADFDGRLRPGMFLSVGAPDMVEAALGIGGRAFTAHPHTDPHSGNLVGWGWRALVRSQQVEATFWEWDGDWAEKGETLHLLDECETAPHDFAVTKSWYVMIQNQIKVAPLPYLAGVKGAGECLVSQPEQPVIVHLIPRPSAVIAATNTDFNESEAAPRKAVKAKGPKASFEIHMALAHDGPPLSEGDDVAPALMDQWVTAYTAGWEELAPGSFLGEWSKAGEWDFALATQLSPDFNRIPR